MNCFGNNKPEITSSDRTNDFKAKTLYNANVISYQRGSCRNYSGNVGFYQNGLLRNTQSFDAKNLLQKGYALCVDGAFSNKCDEQPNLENLINGITGGAELKRGLYACPGNDISGNYSIKLSLGVDSIYNEFRGGVGPTGLTGPFGGLGVIENWTDCFVTGGPTGGTGNTGNPPGSNAFGKIPRETWNQEDTLITSGLTGHCSSLTSTTIIDPDDVLFGIHFCPGDLRPGEGPLKYRKYTLVDPDTGTCKNNSLAFGNKTKQNYMVSYSDKGGKVNFAVNQKLYNKNCLL